MRRVSGAAGWVVLAVVGYGLLTGCGAEPAPSTAHRPLSDCPMGGYEEVATAPTVARLKRELLRVPRVHTVRILRHRAEHGKIPVVLLNRKPRTVLSLDMWQLQDGSWTAQSYWACM